MNRSIAIAVSLVSLVGCNSSDTPVPVAGKVTVNGTPLAGVGITFHPQGGKGRPATAETAADGSYQLTTVNPTDGALRGDYKVTLVWDEQVHPYLTMRDGVPQKEALRADYEKWVAKHKAKASPIPKEYAESSTTPLTQKVPAPGNVANFDVKAAP